MQTYGCAKCGRYSETIFTHFLHEFTDHLHVDIGLKQADARLIMYGCQPFVIRTLWALWGWPEIRN